MDSTSKFLKDKGIVERISFKDKTAHTVELVKDKIDTITNQQGEEKEGVRYLVKENGIPKSFFTTSVGLLQKLSGKEKGDVVIIQMKSKKNADGKYTSYYDVDTPLEGTERGSQAIYNEDVDNIPVANDTPIINENEGDTEIPF